MPFTMRMLERYPKKKLEFSPAPVLPITAYWSVKVVDDDTDPIEVPLM